MRLTADFFCEFARFNYSYIIEPYVIRGVILQSHMLLDVYFHQPKLYSSVQINLPKINLVALPPLQAGTSFIIIVLRIIIP